MYVYMYIYIYIYVSICMYFLICSTRKCNKSFAHGFMHMCTHDSNSKLVYARTKPIYDVDGSMCNTCTFMFIDLFQAKMLPKISSWGS